jgi:dihydrofolate reductase
MRKLVESTFVTLDGVISDPASWGHPYWDDEFAAYARRLLFDADSLLLGRATYEGFATAWPKRTDDDFADRMNALPKHVASRTLTQGTWNATIIDGDVAAAVVRLKEAPGRSILKYGTGELDRTLLPAGLVDELHLWFFPVLAGGGDRLLEGHDLTHLRRIGATAFASGVTVLTLGPKEPGGPAG